MMKKLFVVALVCGLYPSRYAHAYMMDEFNAGGHTQEVCAKKIPWHIELQRLALGFPKSFTHTFAYVCMNDQGLPVGVSVAIKHGSPRDPLFWWSWLSTKTLMEYGYFPTPEGLTVLISGKSEGSLHRGAEAEWRLGNVFRFETERIREERERMRMKREMTETAERANKIIEKYKLAKMD